MSSTLVSTPNGRMPYFPALDGIRALCVLLVMYNHLKTPWAMTPWINGHLGVDYFFILSGFLITTLLCREQFLKGEIDLKAFYWRRVFRIIPVYLVVLLMYCAVSQLPGQHGHWIALKAGMPYFLTMMNEYAHLPVEPNTFMHTWSLGVEEKFYLVWPPLFFFLARTNRARVAVTVALLVVVGLLRYFGDHAIANAYFGLLAGAWTAVALASKYADGILDRVRHLPIALVLTVFTACFLVSSKYEFLIFFFSSAAILLMLHLISAQSWVRTWLESRPMIWLGKRSYSMYLVHLLGMNVFESRIQMTNNWRAILVMMLSYALAAGVAAILYITVEEPCRKAGRRWLKRHGEVAAAV